MTRLIRIPNELFVKENFKGWFGGFILDDKKYMFDTVEELLTFVENEAYNIKSIDKMQLNAMAKQVWNRSLRFKDCDVVKHKLPEESNFTPQNPDTYSKIRTDRTATKR